MKVRCDAIIDGTTEMPYELWVNNGVETMERGGVRIVPKEVVQHIAEGNDKIDLIMMWLATLSDKAYGDLAVEVFGKGGKVGVDGFEPDDDDD